MGRTLTAMLRELRSDKEAIDQTIRMLERLVRERDKESRKLSAAPRKRGTSRAERDEGPQ